MGVFILYAQLLLAAWAAAEWLRTLGKRQLIDPKGWVIATLAAVFLASATFVRLAPILAGHPLRPTPAAAELLAAGFAMMCAFSSARMASRLSPVRVRFWQDAVMIPAALLTVGWSLLVAPVLRESGHSEFASASTFLRTAVLTHRVADLIMISGLVLLCSRLPSLRSSRVLFMVLGQSLIFAADLVDGLINRSDPSAVPTLGVELSWSIGLLLLALTARRLRRVLLLGDAPVAPAASTQVVGRLGLSLPYLPCAGIVAFAGVRASTHTTWTPIETWLAIVATLVVCSRQMLVLYDNRRLLMAVGEREGRLTHQAFHDPLTGLPNRLLFNEHLATEVARPERAHDIALLFCDLDDFKRVNDHLGHSAGDRLLCITAERLRACAPEGAMVARLGGDEFALVFDGDSASAQAAATRVMDAFTEPVELDGEPLLVVVSIGIGQAKAGEGCTSEQLLNQADLAMLAAKSQGKRRYVSFDPAMKPADLLDRTLANEFAAALRDGEIYTAYQPIVELPSRRIVGVETLARWDHPTRGPVPPRQFVQLAKDIGLIEALTDHILRRVAADHAEWRPSGRPAPFVSINIAPSLLLSPDFRAAVERTIAGGLPADRLVLELTDTEAVSANPMVDALLDDLRRLGVRLALDDFGVGNHLLANLRRLPIDLIKIDRSVVIGAESSERDDDLMAGYFDLGRRLDLPVIAVGVETERGSRRLRELGCSLAQGQLLGAPTSAAGVSERLAQDAAAALIPAPRPPARIAPGLGYR